jgi:RNA polymerase sigma factor (sigma-70 family)
VSEKTENLVRAHLGIAQVIAMEYANTPGASFDELYSEACGALLRTAARYDSERGDFEPYAARAIRNALNSYFAAACRRAKLFPRSLDHATQEGGDSASIDSSKEAPDNQEDIAVQVRRRESRATLEKALARLTPRYRTVIEGVRAGKSLSEIGREMQMTKAGAHKLLKPAIERLRTELHALGYSGLDSRGFLRSIQRG